jgi:hypothetical protein
MNVNELAINRLTALLMFWNAGISDLPESQQEKALLAANHKLDSLSQPTQGYWYAKDVSDCITKAIGKVL